jgi:5-methylcytosine-specific restriction endonuclease McrA
MMSSIRSRNSRKMTDVRVVTYFNNMMTITRRITKGKAVNLMLRDSGRGFVPHEADLLEVSSVRDIFIVPTLIWFFVDAALPMRVPGVCKQGLYRREKGHCAYCGRRISLKEATVDHILPKSKGGEDSWINMVLACRRCNLKKGSRTLKEARLTLRIEPGVPRFPAGVH